MFASNERATHNLTAAHNRLHLLEMLTARGVGGPEVAIGDAGPSSSGPDDSVTNTGSCNSRA